MTFSYLAFHALFVAPPVATLALVAVVRRSDGWEGTLGVGVPLMVALALGYTAPWDNYLIARGVWWYGDGAVAATVWLAPLGEYLFIAAQPVLTALWLAQLPVPWPSADGRRGPTPATDGGMPTTAAVRAGPSLRVPVRDRLLGVAGGAAVGAVGWWLLGADGTFYLGAILAWAAPVLALQWGFGWPALWRARRTVALAAAVPTAYLWLADLIAIRAGVWRISAQYTTGLTVAGLPVEEATFFLVTNLFVVQGLVLLRWVSRRW